MLVIDGGSAPAAIADGLDISLSEVHLALAYHSRQPEAMAAVRKRHPERMQEAKGQAIEPPGTLAR